MPNATSDSAGWLVAHTIDGVGEKTITFKTENKFVDQDARVTITTPAASAPTLSLTDIATALDLGSASEGKYSPVVSLSGNANIATAGWITSGNHAVTDSSVGIGTVNQSTLKNGTTTINNGATVNPTDSNQTINISEGYNAARTLIIGPNSAGPKGTVTSGSANISAVSVNYNSTNSNFDVSGSADVSAPTVDTAGYVSSTVGTKNANTDGATVVATLPKISLIGAVETSNALVTPVISKHNNTNISQAGSATTTQPSSGYYIAVHSAANTGTVRAIGVVQTAGYGTATSGQYSSSPSEDATVGASASAITYISIDEATFANAATSGTTYTDISSTGPILISGDYLYINPGYTSAKKISLARLVPDATGTNAAAAYILSGYTAYDNNGALITGTMQTYTGLYEVT